MNGSASHTDALACFFFFFSLMQRHRAVNEALANELKSGVHALAIVAKTPAQWAADPSVLRSPACMGGGKH